ncbi:type II toxin-antitoxin system Phd/YefM family antitoxin [candidate division KSB1 bacterium]|nr:type II toxin-antitoxin system Phd/YefM family antitoxin [candidate division KSB1 bacterium]
MNTVSKSVLKAKMLEYFREVEQTGEELIVTSNNVPTLKVVPILKNKSVDQVFGDLRDSAKIADSIMEAEIDEWSELP